MIIEGLGQHDFLLCSTSRVFSNVLRICIVQIEIRA